MTGAPRFADRFTGGSPRTRSTGHRLTRRTAVAVLGSTVAVAGAGLVATVALLGSAGPASAASAPEARSGVLAPQLNVPSIPASVAAAPTGLGPTTLPGATQLITNPSLGTGTDNNAAAPSLSGAGIATPQGPQGPAKPAQPSAGTVGISLTGINGKPSQSITVLLLLTVLSVAPALLILCTSFTKIIVVLSMTRNAMGLQTIPPNQVLAGLALFLSLFIMGPTLSKVNHDGLQPYLHGTKTQQAAWTDGSAPLKTWMLAQTRTDDLNMLTNLAKESKAQAAQAQASEEPNIAAGAASTGVPSTGATTPDTTGGSGDAGSSISSLVGAAATASGSTTGSAAATAADTAADTAPTGSDARVTATAAQAAKISMTTLVPAFILSELKSAFILGFVIFLPFLIIDLVVASSLMSLGMAMVPPVLVSLPFKILLFLMVDGWALIIHSLVVSYR